ncbi:uncharacterized protein V6R79_020299 [Siganus canaliculatus]
MRANACLVAPLLLCMFSAAATRSRPKVQEVQEVQKGGWTTLPCPGLAAPPVTWRRRTCRLPAEDILTVSNDRDNRHIHDPNRRFSSQSDMSLHIRSVTEDDSGTYRCNDSAAVELIVVSPASPRLEAMVRTNVTLMCPEGVGGPRGPSWSRDGEEIKPNTRIRFLYDSTLSIRTVKPSDSGLYCCDGKPAGYLRVLEDVPQVSLGLLLAIVSSVSLLFIIVITVSVVCFVRRRRLKQREAEEKCVVYEQIDEQLTFLSPQGPSTQNEPIYHSIADRPQVVNKTDASNQNEPIYHTIAERPLVVNKTDSSPPEESHYSVITAVPLGQNNEGTVDHQPTVWPRLVSQVSAGHRFFLLILQLFRSTARTFCCRNQKQSDENLRLHLRVQAGRGLWNQSSREGLDSLPP